jgi:arginase family enzyme
MSRMPKRLLAAAAIVAGGAVLTIALGTTSHTPVNAAAMTAASKIEKLAPEKRAFITDPKELARFELTPEKLELIFANFDDAGVDTYVSALMNAVASSQYKDGDFTEMPLNTKFARFNAGMTLRPPILDTYPRDAGTFSLDRYVQQKGGIPTFAKAPVAIRKDDLVASRVEVAFIGVPLDLSSGWRDAKHAPAFMRAMKGLSGIDPDTGINTNVALRLADYGNASVDNYSGERTVAHARQRIREIVSAGTVPFVVGGDHSVMYGSVAATVDELGQGNVSLVLVDAYAEMQLNEHTSSDTQSLRRLLRDGLVSPKNVTIVALRDPTLSPQDREQMVRDGVRIYGMSDIRKMGWPKALEAIGKDARRGAPNVYVSFDINALDPAYAVAAGRPVPGGLSVVEAKDLTRTLCTQHRVVGFDMLDVAPVLDPTYQTTMNANSVMHSCLAGIAQRKTQARR